MRLTKLLVSPEHEFNYELQRLSGAIPSDHGRQSAGGRYPSDGSLPRSLYLLYTLATQVLVLLPILLVAVAPQQSAQPLQAVQTWLARNNRVITVTVSLVFGLWFLYKGIGGLIA